MTKQWYDVASELDDVFLADMSVAEVRELAGHEALPEELSTALDEAQGVVFTGKANAAFVVLRIRG